MQRLYYFIFFLGLMSFAQKPMKAVLKDSVKIKAKTIFDIDSFGTLYYSKNNNSFNKTNPDTTITYSNFQLNTITSANAFNPLKINLFYQDFNTVIVLDNRLAEIYKVDFNTIEPYKNVTFVSTGFSNTLWLFNQNKQLLELYDYKTNTVKLKTVPVQSNALALKSDYNYCYLLTENFLYVYNYFGSLIGKYKNEGYESMAFSKGQLVLNKGNELYILSKDDTKITPINHPNLLINQFLVTNETLYIYHDDILRQYQLKTE